MTALDLAPRVHDARWRAAQVDETVALRWCALYRKIFRRSAMSYPADLLRLGAVAAWVSRHGVGVDVTTVDELDYALAADVSPLRIVMHGELSVTNLCALDAGVGKFVVKSGKQVVTLAGAAQRIQLVLIDVTDQCAEDMAAEVVSTNRLDLIGLHCQLGDADDETAADIVRGMISQMSRVRRKHGVILTRLSLGGLETTAGSGDRSDLRRAAELLDDAVEDGCARHRYPRPALVLSPSRGALLPPA